MHLVNYGENNVKERVKGVMKHKKNRIITGIVAIVLIAVVALVFAINGTNNNGEPDLSFLNIDNTVNKLALSFDGVKVDIVNKESYIVNPNAELIKLFNKNEWEIFKNVKNPLQIFAPYMMFELSEKNTIYHLYLDRNSNLAEIQYNDGFRYYKLPENVIDNIEEYILKNGKAIEHNTKKSDEIKNTTEITQLQEEIEKNIEIIIYSPKESSNLEDYIKEHSKEYETIIKMGDDALSYLLSEFEKGNANGLKGQMLKGEKLTSKHFPKL